MTTMELLNNNPLSIVIIYMKINHPTYPHQIADQMLERLQAKAKSLTLKSKGSKGYFFYQVD
jgi:hypothetical protein